MGRLLLNGLSRARVSWTRCLWTLAVAWLTIPALGEGELMPVAGEKRPQDRAAIRDHIDSIFKAYINKDRPSVRSTHATQWRGFLTNTRSLVRGIEEYMSEAEIALSRPRGMTDYRMLDFDVLFYGDVAVVPYIAELTVKIGDTRIAPKLRVLDVYAKLGGHWIQVASNTVLHPDTQGEYRQFPRPLAPAQRQQLLEAREAVWRAWFSNDSEHLDAVIPAETVAINAGAEAWSGRAEILGGAEGFAASGGRLVRLEFPQTEIQVYGDIAILYTVYEFETVTGGAAPRQIRPGQRNVCPPRRSLAEFRLASRLRTVGSTLAPALVRKCPTP